MNNVHLNELSRGQSMFNPPTDSTEDWVKPKRVAVPKKKQPPLSAEIKDVEVTWNGVKITGLTMVRAKLFNPPCEITGTADAEVTLEWFEGPRSIQHNIGVAKRGFLVIRTLEAKPPKGLTMPATGTFMVRRGKRVRMLFQGNAIAWYTEKGH